MAPDADPRITGEWRSSLARVQNTRKIAMQRRTIVSKAEREEIARIMKKYPMGRTKTGPWLYTALSCHYSCYGTNKCHSCDNGADQPPLTAGMPRAPPF